MVNEKEMAEVLITLFNLEGVESESIDPEAALFSEGVGLDSVDAIELSVYLNNEYAIQFTSMEENMEAFASLKALTAYINAKVAADA